MCIAIYQKENNPIKKETLETCFDNNPDGSGFVYRESVNSKPICKKGYFKFEEFYSEYKEIKNFEALLHFRIATSGKLNEANCHPFQVNDKHYLIHNGVLHGFPYTKKRSDTNYLSNILLKDIDITNKHFQLILENAIGDNKIVVMPYRKECFILNEDLGNWVNGNWFSNDSYQTCKWLNYSSFPYSVHSTTKDETTKEYLEKQKLDYYLPSELETIYERYPEMEYLSVEEMEDSLFNKPDYCITTGKLI